MKKKLILFFLSEFFGSLDFARGLFVLFLASRGMGMGAVGVLQTLLFWSNLIFEVPAGYLADRFLRKYSLAAGLTLTAGAAALMPFAQSFEVFAIVFILHGMGFAFRSGADTALLYDELRSHGMSERFVELSSRSRSLVNIGLVIAMGAGGLLHGAWGWTVVYMVFAVSMLIAAVLVLMIDETPHQAPEEKGETVRVWKNLKEFSKSPTGRSLLYFIFGMGFLEAMHAPFFIFGQTYFKEAGLAESHVSLVIAGSLALTSIGYLFVDRLSVIPIAKLIQTSTLLLTFLIAIFLFRPSLMTGIALFALIDMIPALIFVHSDNFINQQVPSKIRASFLSVQSLVSSVFISFAYLGGGQALEHWSAVIFMGSMAVLPLIGFLFLGFYFRNQAMPLRTAEEGV